MCWHKWTKWATVEVEKNRIHLLDIHAVVAYTTSSTINDKIELQMRTCEKCGREQRAGFL